jgi:hypothetical protein
MIAAATSVDSPAPPKRPFIELRLTRPEGYLDISCSSGSHAQAAVVLQAAKKGSAARRLVFAMSSFGGSREEQFSLCLKYSEPTLWLASAAINVSVEEARRIEDTFAAHGLTVERNGAQS